MTTQVVQALGELSELLAKYGWDERSRFLVDVAGTSDSEIWRVVSGLEFWGGSGAIWEAEPFYLSHGDSAETRADYRRFGVLLEILGEALESRGLDELSRDRVPLVRMITA